MGVPCGGQLDISVHDAVELGLALCWLQNRTIATWALETAQEIGSFIVHSSLIERSGSSVVEAWSFVLDCLFSQVEGILSVVQAAVRCWSKARSRIASASGQD